ncbi:hypothetical protein F5Y16DRAFT_244461 [Xylariaceae sp. FL0255]|nr:hypothetical protein F5Y16DRAFT_244461 [Xylariaceae sp. FL0255]
MGRTAKATTASAFEGKDRTQLLHDLELKHQKNESDGHLLVKDEDARRLKLRILLLRDENVALRDQIELNSSTTSKLTTQCDTLNAQLEAQIEAARSQEKQLRKQEREYANLKAELQAMNDATETSANVLSEKLALSRELAVLKPEIEHLRSQVNHQQTTLTEKLALERQVNTLEVELANEKKATRRAMQSRESNDRAEDDLRKKLREVEKSLTAEKAERERLEDQIEQQRRTHEMALQDQDSTREVEADLRKKLADAQRQLRGGKEEKERLEEQLQVAQRAAKKLEKTQAKTSDHDELRAQLEESQENLVKLQKKNAKLEREHETKVSELEDRGEQMQDKLDKMKTKLRELHEELKKSQADLQKAQEQAQSIAHVETKKVPVKPANAQPKKAPVKSQAIRKRKAAEVTGGDFSNIEIQTPSAEDTTKVRKAMKKATFEPTAVGEKSAFSITPFLNRSKTGSDDASNVEDELEDSILGPQSARTSSGSVPADETVKSNAAKPTTTKTEVDAIAESEEAQPAQKVRGRPKKVLGDAPSAKQNAIPQTAASKKAAKSKINLGIAPESTEVEEPANDACEVSEPAEKTAAVRFNPTPADESNNNSRGPQEPAPKMKKRKVLGSTKTLFDEDEGEKPADRKPAKAALGGAKRALNKPGAFGGAKRANAFAGAASFSPLKRDRRGVGASFLA